MKIISEQTIINSLNNYYGIKVHTLKFLPLGADQNASVYKAETEDNSYFIKLKRGNHDDANIAVMKLLQASGVRQIIIPIETLNGQSILHAEGFSLIVYPFVMGENGFNQSLSEEQWIILGRELRKLHEIDVPILLRKILRKEIYSPKFRDSVRSILDYIETANNTGEVALKLQNFMKINVKTILRLVDSAEELAKNIENDSHEFVLCHSDIHAGNVLIDANNHIYIVDWDEPIMAPKERDLMFIGGGVRIVWNKPHEEEFFYKGYGKVEIDSRILAYYRLERIVEDIAEFCEIIFFSLLSDEEKLESYNHFKGMFEPRGVVEIAFETLQKIG